MNNIIDEPETKELKGRVFKDRAIWVGTFLGGPLVAGYMFAENYKVFNQPANAKRSWLIAIIGSLSLLGGIFLISDVNIPNQIIPIAYTLVIYGLFTKYQGAKVKRHIDNGGEVQGWPKIIGVGIIGLVLMLLPIFGFVYATEAIHEANTTTKYYGSTVKHEIDFDQSNVSENEIDNLAEGLKRVDFFDEYSPKYVYVVKDDDTYELFLSVVAGTENDPLSIQGFKEIRDQLNSYYPNNDVKIKLVVEYLDNVVKVIE